MIIAAYLGVAGLVDVGYRFYTSTETAVAARVTAGIADAGIGWYSVDATIPTTAASVRWDSTGTPAAVAREYLDIDPWTLAVPNGYAAGTAGNVLGNNLNATVSSRAAPGAAMTLTSAYDAAKTAAAPGAAMTLTSAERTNVGIAVRDTDNAPSIAGTVGGDIKAANTGDPWSKVLPGSYAAGSAGKIIGDNIDAKVSTRMTQASYVTPPTAAQNAAATRDVSNASPAGGSLGADIKNASAVGDPWSTLLPGSYGAGSAGKLLSDNLDAKVSTRAQAGAAMTLTSPERDAVAAAVRDVNNSTPAASSLGADVKLGATKDPLASQVPGAYGAGTAGKILGDRLDVLVSSRLANATYVTPPDANTIAAATRDVNNQTPAANSLGAAINSAASAGDPWSTQLPGAYAAGTAGKIVGDRIDALVSSRLAASAYVTPPTKEVIAIATRDVDNSNPVSGSMGDKINQGASAGDPWSTILPGSYGAGTAGKLMSDNLDAKVSTRLPASSYVAPPLSSDIASAVRDVDNRTPAPNSLGAAVNSAASAGDPWTTLLPGSYGANTAGSIIGNQLDAAVSSRLAANSYTSPPSVLSIAQATRDVDNTNPAANSLGAAVNRSASAGDPWGAQLPNAAYGPGTAGKLISDTMNAPVASRLAASAYVVPPNTSQIAAATRDVDNTNPPPGSLGAGINSAASAGDPWATALPGAYSAGTAGDLIGNNVDAKISTRMPAGSYVAPPGIQQIAEGVRDVDNTNPAVNSLGADIKTSAATGDPWAIHVPGGYVDGTAGKLIGDNLDAKISTRSTYAGTDTPGTTTLLTRVPGPINVSGGKVDVADKTGFSLTSDYDKAKTAAQPGDAMALTTNERTTLSSSIWQYLTSLMTSAGTIGKLLIDQLNVPVASRLASSAYVAPDNASITAIKAKTDTIPPNPALTTDVPTVAQVAAGVRDVSNAAPAAGSLGADVKAGIATVSDPWAVNVPGSYPPGSAGNALGNNLDAKISTRLATNLISLNAGAVTVGTNNDKNGYSLSSGQASAIADEILKRDWQQVSGEATFSVLNALRFLRDAWEVKPDGTLVVYKENGQIAWTRTVKADAEALPITGVQ